MRNLRDIITGRQFITVKSTQSVLEAAKLMASRHVGAVLVTEGKTLDGILTERDIIARVVATERNAANMTIAKVMTRDPITMTPDKPFSHALILMANGGFRHMPVVENGEVVGIVSSRDATGVEHEEMDRLLETLEHITGNIR